MNSQLSNVISPAQFSSSWILCFHDTWPLLSWNSLLSTFLMIPCLHGSLLTSLFQFRFIFPLSKSRQASPKCPVHGHLLFMLSLHIHIPSYTFHYFLNANEPQVCIMNCSLSCSFTFLVPIGEHVYIQSCFSRKVEVPLNPIPHRGGLTFYPTTCLVWLSQWPQFLCLTLHSFL